MSLLLFLGRARFLTLPRSTLPSSQSSGCSVVSAGLFRWTLRSEEKSTGGPRNEIFQKLLHMFRPVSAFQDDGLIGFAFRPQVNGHWHHKRRI